jgi:hypothetical protein
MGAACAVGRPATGSAEAAHFTGRVFQVGRSVRAKENNTKGIALDALHALNM